MAPAEPVMAPVPPTDPLPAPEKVPVTVAVKRSIKRTFDMFAGNHEIRRPEDADATEMLMRIKMHDEYECVRNVADQANADTMQALPGFGAGDKLAIADDATREARQSLMLRHEW